MCFVQLATDIVCYTETKLELKIAIGGVVSSSTFAIEGMYRAS